MSEFDCQHLKFINLMQSYQCLCFLLQNMLIFKSSNRSYNQKLIKMAQVPKENRIQIIDLECKEEDNSSQPIYKIQLNSIDIENSEDQKSCKYSKISNTSDPIEQVKNKKRDSATSDISLSKNLVSSNFNKDKKSRHSDISQRQNTQVSLTHHTSMRTRRVSKDKKRIKSIEIRLNSQNFKNYKIDMRENGDCLVVMESGQKMLIRNSQEKHLKPAILPGWERQNRIGCCCFSMSKETFCFSCCMISSLCICIQRKNICCFCQDTDCSYCCVTDCCKECCFQKTYGQCSLQCCKSLPCCTIYNCLVHGKQIDCSCLKTFEKVFFVCCEYFGKCCCAVAICLCICCK